MNEEEQKDISKEIAAVLRTEEDVLLQTKTDRRILSNVPDKNGGRSNADRRGRGTIDDLDNPEAFIEIEQAGRRYLVDYPVKAICYLKNGQKKQIDGQATDISTTGILISFGQDDNAVLAEASRITLQFVITPGSMPEGYEMKVRDIEAKMVRSFQSIDGVVLHGMEFEESLAQYTNRKRRRYMLSVAAVFLFVVTLFIILLRAESIVYFKFNKFLYLYSIIAATFLLTRYLFGACYRPMPINKNFTPGVTIIIPCFNEEQWIQRTIISCVNQDYPTDKLEILVVDDCSNDKSVEKINEIIEVLKKEQRYDIQDRVSCIVQPTNEGKREALAVGALVAKHELIVFVDSDSFLDPFAIRNLVQPFQDNRMGGVSGRTDVANTYTNALTKMQSVRYYIAFRVMKAAEAYFDAVTCLSGPLSCYRKDLIIKYMDDWLNQSFLGQRATFGDDRSMTNFILRHDRTGYQDTAICNTIVPNTHKLFLKQQMRWKRSWLRESLIAAGFMWRKEPFMALSFYMGLLVPIAAPIIVTYNLFYIPIMHRVFPLTFLVGLFMMAFLMSMAQLFLRRSTTWVYGLWFCVYYEAVLLWQMPIAWFTFWKSTWGTRMTPADLLELSKSLEKKGVTK